MNLWRFPLYIHRYVPWFVYIFGSRSLLLHMRSCSEDTPLPTHISYINSAPPFISIDRHARRLVCVYLGLDRWFCLCRGHDSNTRTALYLLATGFTCWLSVGSAVSALTSAEISWRRDEMLVLGVVMGIIYGCCLLSSCVQSSLNRIEGDGYVHLLSLIF